MPLYLGAPLEWGIYVFLMNYIQDRRQVFYMMRGSINNRQVRTVNSRHPAHPGHTHIPAVRDSDPYSIPHPELYLDILQFEGWPLDQYPDVIPTDHLWYRTLFPSHNSFYTSVASLNYTISCRFIGTLELKMYTLVMQELDKVLGGKYGVVDNQDLNW